MQSEYPQWALSGWLTLHPAYWRLFRSGEPGHGQMSRTLWHETSLLIWMELIGRFSAAFTTC
jgi:hypothetical protein